MDALQRRSCQNCRAYAPPPGPRIPEVGSCRLRAPVLADSEHFFPPVLPAMWCLEFIEQGEDDHL